MIKEFEKRLLSSMILIPISIFFIIKGSIFFVFFLSILFLATSYEWVKMNKKNDLAKFSGVICLILKIFYLSSQYVSLQISVVTYLEKHSMDLN